MLMRPIRVSELIMGEFMRAASAWICGKESVLALAESSPPPQRRWREQGHDCPRLGDERAEGRRRKRLPEVARQRVIVQSVHFAVVVEVAVEPETVGLVEIHRQRGEVVRVDGLVQR